MKRSFVKAKDVPIPKTGVKSADLTVLQWNVLAMGLSWPCQPDSFVVESPMVLDWKTRSKKVIDCIIEANSDLIGLQEVDNFKEVEGRLKEHGYEGHFEPKPSSPCLYQPGNIGPDGNAVFFRRSKFEKLDWGAKTLELLNGHSSNSTVLWVKLREKVTGAILTFMTTHLKAGRDEKYANTRKGQALDLVKTVECFKRDGLVICTGDFNGEPFEKMYGIVATHLSSAYFSGKRQCKDSS